MAEIKHLTNGIDVAIFGEGSRPFVIIPGINVSQIVKLADQVENAYNPVFKNDFKMYLIDWLEDMPERYSLEDMANDCIGALKELGIEHACIFGASQGGLIAQIVAAKHPELIDKVVIGSAAYHQTPTSIENFSEWIRLAESGDYAATNRYVFKRIYPKEMIEANEAVFKKMETNGNEKEFAHFIILTKATLDFDGTKYLPELQKQKDKILTIGDWTDDVFTGEASEELAEKIGCEHYMYNGYGHTAFDNAPDYKERIKAFFSK